MYCVLCTIGVLLLTLFVVFKLAFFASFTGIYQKNDAYGNDNDIEQQYDVIIMGGGISGIAAATELYKKGITNILIIEAQSYVGGRIKTVEIDGQAVNIGAEMLYGACTVCKNQTIINKPNPILQLLNKYNMEYFIEDTLKIPDEHKKINAENIKHLHDLYGDEDLYIFDKLGMNGILLHLAASLIENGVDILLNEPIHTISHDINGVVVSTKNSIYRSKYAINTFSFGVLQGNLVDFIPALPTWKYDAIFKHKMAKYASIYIKWPYNIWFNTENTENTLFRIQNKKYSILVQNMNYNKYFSGSNVWKIDIIHDNAFMEKNIYEFVTDNIKKYFDEWPKALDVVVSDWNTNIYIKGVYSIFINNYKNNENSNIDYDDHWKRIKSRVGNIFFCGDGTSSKQHGTITGAYSEGIQAAQQIAACFKSELFGKCQMEYFERDGSDIFIDILKEFTDDYRFYFVLSLRFVVIRLFVLLLFIILIIRRIVKYILKDSF